MPLDNAKNIFESIGTAIMTTNLSGALNGINKATEEMFEVTRSKVIGLHYKEIMPPEEVERIEKTVAYVIRTGKTYYGRDIDFRIKTNKTVTINPTISLLKDKNDQILGIIMVVEDVTEKRLFERHLQRAEKLASLGEMVVGIAHEMRNPLGAIHGFASLILFDQDLPAQHKKFLEIIIAEAERLSKINQELLVFAKPTAQNFQETYLNEIISQVLILFELETQIHEIELEKKLSPALPYIYGDLEGLKQVFINILFNAMQATGDKGKISIKTYFDDDREWVITEISDNGYGILPENIGKIFDPFFSTKEKGTGLGLAICHRIISAHHGVIDVSSKLKEGTVFRIKLPSRERMMILG